MQGPRRTDYSSIQMNHVEPAQQGSSRSMAALVGVAVGCAVVALSTQAPALNLHVNALTARVTSVGAQAAPVAMPAFRAPSATAMHASAPQSPVQGQARFQQAAQQWAPVAAPSQASGFSVGSFLAGCAVAATAFLVYLRNQAPAPARARAVAAAVAEEEHYAMCNIAAHQNIDKAPDVLSRGDEDVFSMRRKFEAMCRDAQDKIVAAVEECDGEAKFREDAWVREDGGGGISRVLSGGKVFEKAGVNLSVVYGTMPQEALAAATARGAEYTKDLKEGERVPFFACGLSSVMHPRNPHCPTMHFNYRYFETEGGAWWFGGGTDITPAYLDEDDMKHFHGSYKEVCDKHDPAFYAKYKKWADDYFVIKHRNETRGLGGIFFDDLNDRAPETIIKFSTDCLANVIPAYIPIVEKNKDKEFSEKEKQWQLMRRGRYVEFNLVYDRGTIFGLKTGGRIESILMSLPETAQWQYDFHPEPGSPEEEITKAFQNPREWC